MMVLLEHKDLGTFPYIYPISSVTRLIAIVMMVVVVVMVSVWSEMAGPVFFHDEVSTHGILVLFSHCLKRVILICEAG